MSDDSPTASATSADAEAPRPAGAGLAPGQAFGGRYRVVSLLGRGGMGEVYRVDDLKLGQPAALKLLPDRLALSPERLAQFHAEVRLAREVTHLNVCRVFDIGEHDGRHYLTMEYVDGEDLASLLKRIGRLPAEKALEIAQQICAGLAAAHARGVLHRDLKPANVMLDGRGQVRIMDFGLATRAGESTDGVVAGTPAYMAPEQFHGALSERSDVYALGLILYELFTGHRPFEARSVTEWAQRHREATPGPPSTLVKDLPRDVEAVILRCLEKDPVSRPASALAVVAALPGGDPLAAALAAGQTPSPQLVAAAGEAGDLRPRVVLVLGLAVAAAMTAATLLGARASIIATVALPRSPEVLEDRARQIAAAAGYSEPPADEARFFELDFEARRALSRHLAGGGDAASGIVRWLPIRFVYRSAREPLTPRFFRVPIQNPMVFAVKTPGRVVRDDPALDRPGMVRIELAPDGRLLSFWGLPGDGGIGASSPEPAPGEPDYGPLFAAAGLEASAWTPATPGRPPLPGDRWRAWERATPDGGPARVEAGSLGGRPVLFEVVPEAAPVSLRGPSAGMGSWLMIALAALVTFAGAIVARRNVRQGRGDWAGACRLAFVVCFGYWLQWAIGASHVPTEAEIDLATLGTSRAAYLALLAWIVYLALEPYVRRRWPQMLISWSRFLGGRPLDPRVGCDVAIGILGGSLASAALSAMALLSPRFGWVPWLRSFEPDALAGVSGALESTLGEALFALISIQAIAFLLVLSRIALRQQWLAASVLVLLLAGMSLGAAPGFRVGMLLFFALMVFLLLRFGLVAGIVHAFTAGFLDHAGAALAAPAWAAAGWVVPLGLLVVLAAVGLRAALGRQPLLNALDD